MLLAGGVRVVVECARELCALGHEVFLVYPEIPGYEDSWWKGMLRRALYRTLSQLPADTRWFQTPARLVPVVSPWHGIPDADVVVATAWNTAEWVASYPARKGRKFYLVQGYETWNGPKERVEATYRLPLRKIVVSSWLKGIMKEQFHEEVLGPVVPGVRLEQFYHDGKTDHSPSRLGMLFHNLECKGMDDGLAALSIVAREVPEIRLVTFGVIRLRSGQRRTFPCAVELHENPPQDTLREIYSSCDIWLCPSRGEGGPPLTSLEASACQCALVTTDIGAVRDVYQHDVSALVSPPCRPDLLADHVLALLKDPERRQRLSQAGCQRARQFTWKRFAGELLACLESRPGEVTDAK
jgi:glycosyltransferase involved in cell wall biosynthesis